MKLELKHLAPYLPYGLKVEYTGKEKGIFTLIGLRTESDIFDFQATLRTSARPPHNYFFTHKNFKPILRPWDDLKETITHNGLSFVPSSFLYDNFGVSVDDASDLVLDYYEIGLTDSPLTGFSIIMQMIEWHFDVFGLIDSGLAISYKEAGL